MMKLKENLINNCKTLNELLDNEEQFEVKTKLFETINRLKVEKFDQLNFLKLKTLEKSI